MVTATELSEWLRVSQNTPRVRVRRICQRTIVYKCKLACRRAALGPCITACLRVVADPAVNDIGLPSILTHILNTRARFLKTHRYRPEPELKALNERTNYCLKTCVPYWARQWAEFCDIALKRVCVRVCTGVCQRNYRRSCRLPCMRTPFDLLHTREAERARIWRCLLICINACVQGCMRACQKLAPKWLSRKAKHICRLDKNKQPTAADATI